MAVINIDDVYILDETGAEVDKVTGLFTKNENATTDEKQMARLNIAAGGSNRNLLDNWYFVGGGSQLGDGVFPINQRGQTTYSTVAWNMDRWYGACTLYSNYLYIPSFIEQNANYPLNTPLTMSAMLEDGTIVSGTATFSDRTTQQYFYTDGVNIQLVRAADGMPMIWTGVGVNVKAAKLEVGTVSTLANDAPPDYYDELDHCKWYFERIKALSGNYAPMGFGFAASATAATIFVPMHAKRGSGYTVSTSGSFRLVNGQTTYSVTAISKYASVPNNWLILTVTSSGMTAGQPLEFGARGDGAAYIDVNNDL